MYEKPTQLLNLPWWRRERSFARSRSIELGFDGRFTLYNAFSLNGLHIKGWARSPEAKPARLPGNIDYSFEIVESVQDACCRIDAHCRSQLCIDK